MRNLGLLSFPVCEAVPVALVLALDPEAPRFIEAAQTCTLLGVAVPLVRLQPHEGVLAIKAELALASYGTQPLPFASD